MSNMNGLLFLIMRRRSMTDDLQSSMADWGKLSIERKPLSSYSASTMGWHIDCWIGDAEVQCFVIGDDFEYRLEFIRLRMIGKNDR